MVSRTQRVSQGLSIAFCAPSVHAMVLARARHLFWRLLCLDAICLTLKMTVRRVRPFQKDGVAKLDLLPYGSFDTSFPSGHTAYATFLASDVARRYGGVSAAVAYAMATGVAASRVRLRMHHVSDVVAGATLGAVFALARLF